MLFFASYIVLGQTVVILLCATALHLNNKKTSYVHYTCWILLRLYVLMEPIADC